MKHKPDKDWTVNNRESIEQSDKNHQCGCTVCKEFFLASKVTEFGGATEQNGICPCGCGTDSVIPEKDFGPDRREFKCAVIPPALVRLATTQITVKESNIYTGKLSICRRYDVNDAKWRSTLLEELLNRGMFEKTALNRLGNLPFPHVFLLKVVKKDYLYSNYDENIETDPSPIWDDACIINSRDELLLSTNHEQGIDKNTTKVKGAAQALKKMQGLYQASLTKDHPPPSHFVFDRGIHGDFYAVGTEYTSTQSTEAFQLAQQAAQKYLGVDESDWVVRDPDD